LKCQDIINQLQIVLPQLTDLFTDTQSVVSIVPAGAIANLTSSAAHGFSAGNNIYISDARSPIVISSITRVDTIATAITATPHDLTNDFFENVLLSGANEAEFNGTFEFLNQVNRKTFTFKVPDSGALTATGSMLLEDPASPFGYNGLQTVLTVPTPTTLTYDLPAALTETATGTILLHGNLRLSGAATFERALSMYTKQGNNDLWAFVVLDDFAVSKDRTARNDAITAAGAGGDRRQQLIQSASVYVFANTTDDISGRVARDLMVDILGFLLKCLVGVQFDSSLDAQENLGLVYVGDDIELYDSAVYAHRFSFQLLTSITENDTVDPDLSVAFRDISLTMATSLGTETLLADIDLDDEPLP